LSDCGQAFVALAALEGQSVLGITDGVNARRNKFLVNEIHGDEWGIVIDLPTRTNGINTFSCGNLRKMIGITSKKEAVRNSHLHACDYGYLVIIVKRRSGVML
jgi:hypothetical protein